MRVKVFFWILYERILCRDIHRHVVMNDWRHFNKFDESSLRPHQMLYQRFSVFIWFHSYRTTVTTSLTAPPNFIIVSFCCCVEYLTPVRTIIYVSLWTKIALQKLLLVIEISCRSGLFLLGCGQPKHNHLILTKN